MRSSSECLAINVVLCSFILMISSASANVDDQSSNVFNPDTYQFPELHFNSSQPKIIITTSLNPENESTGLQTLYKTTLKKSLADPGLPVGAIIHHSKTGISTVFNQSGYQLFSAEDSLAFRVSTPNGMAPATIIHEIPSGSMVYSKNNTNYIISDNQIILVEINENEDTPLSIIAQPPPENTFQVNNIQKLSENFPSNYDPYPVIWVEGFGARYDPYINTPYVKRYSADWIVPTPPRVVNPDQVQYIAIYETAFIPNDSVAFDSIFLTSALEWNYYPNQWDITTWYHHNENGGPGYFSKRAIVNSGDLISGEIYNDASNWHIKTSTQSGDSSEIFLQNSQLDNRDTWLNGHLIATGNATFRNDSFIGDTTFTNFHFININNEEFVPYPIYYGVDLVGKPEYTNLSVENNIPYSFFLGTSPKKELYSFSVTNTDGAINQTTGKWTWNEHARDDIIYMTDYFNNDNNWNNVKWTQKFSKEWPDVTKGNFNVNPLIGENTLNEATLHYHTGHGTSAADGTNSILRLLEQEQPLPSIDLSPTEVEGKWGGNNKWVILSSCLVLRDNQWEKVFALSHGTHGILGYKTVSTPRKTFMKTFFEYAKTYSVRDSYLLTVKQFDLDTVVLSPDGKLEHLTAAVVFSDEVQAFNDYLPGFGSGIQPDANPVDPVWDQWPKKSDGGV